jgi:hypothetical protein
LIQRCKISLARLGVIIVLQGLNRELNTCSILLIALHFIMSLIIVPFIYEDISYQASITSVTLINISIFRVEFDDPAIWKVFGREFRYMYKDEHLFSVTPATNQNLQLVDHFRLQILRLFLNNEKAQRAN